MQSGTKDGQAPSLLHYLKQSNNSTVWDMVWGCPAPPKVRVFAWRVATNGLATWENKLKRKIVTSDNCVLCGMEWENTFHVFCRCPMARDLWDAMNKV
jgi:hypothetical protein